MPEREPERVVPEGEGEIPADFKEGWWQRRSDNDGGRDGATTTVAVLGEAKTIRDGEREREGYRDGCGRQWLCGDGDGGVVMVTATTYRVEHERKRES